MSETPPAGWYPDPADPAGQRYWDGSTWTEHTAAGDGRQPQPEYAAAGARAAAPSGGEPQTWLWQSIVATLLCCLPAGVVGIVFAAKAQSANGRGDWAEAAKAAGTARTWTLVSIGLGVVAGIIGLAFAFLGVAADSGGF